MPPGGWTLPAGLIVDRPRFAWRASMLDVARHFFTVDEVKQHIDALALYKINVLHLHLADDQGWRIEIRSHPRLTELGGSMQVGSQPGGFYTQAEYSEIVRYAQERYMTVVPEIDMPAHTNAALIAYPQLSCSRRPPAPYTGTEVGFSAFCHDREETYRLIEDVVREIAALTPGEYFHMGGDEVEMLNDEQYVHFVERVQDIVTRAGKRMVGWEEVSKARLLPTSLAQLWKSDSAAIATAAAAAVRAGAKVIVSPANRAYLDMKYDANTSLGLTWAALIEVRDAYDWDPVTFIPGVRESDVVGVEAPLWAETIRNITAAHYLAFPRLPAIAEIGWTPVAGRDWESFRVRLAAQAPRWQILGVNYYRSPQIPWAR
jgi:hexosaminidase